MKKKIFLVLLVLTLLAGSVFAESKHKAGDLLIGLDLGAFITTNIFTVREDTIPKGDYAVAFDLGLNVDYYLFNWLSFSSGLFMHGGAYLLWDKPFELAGDFSDWAKTPVCFTLPVIAHINVPILDFLYFGAGVTLNFPVSSLWDEAEAHGIDTKGGFYLGIPLDFGFDFIKTGKGGSRFFFRVMPEIHKGGTPILVGFIWQPYNFKIK